MINKIDLHQQKEHQKTTYKTSKQLVNFQNRFLTTRCQTLIFKLLPSFDCTNLIQSFGPKACSVNDLPSPVCLQIPTIITGLTIRYISLAFI